jgi:hypothetical protein
MRHFTQTDNIISEKPTQPFTLTIYRQHFTLVLPMDSKESSYTYQGTVSPSETQSISGQKYILSSSEIKGEVSSELNHGIKWSYNIEIPSRSLSIKR